MNDFTGYLIFLVVITVAVMVFLTFDNHRKSEDMRVCISSGKDYNPETEACTKVLTRP